MTVEHKWVDIQKLSGEANFPKGTSQADRITGACDQLALEGWEACAQLWTSTHLLFRRSFEGPRPMTLAAITTTVFDALIEQAMLPIDANKDAWVNEAWQPVMDALLELSGCAKEPVKTES